MDSTKETKFTIVIAGSMNPMIQHPLWYKMAGIVSDDVVDFALKKSAITIVSPQVAQFQTKSFFYNVFKINGLFLR